MKEKITGAEALMRSLEHEGVETLFGYPGGSIMPVYDALYDHRDTLNHILVRHEQCAAHAAQGYARVSGKVGVCLVTSGPGATNTITGIADAMMDSTPIVVIAGQVGAGFLGTDAFQEVDLVGVTQPITKWNYQIRRAEDVAWAVSRAFYIARSGRPGPVVLDFTKNAQTDTVDYEPKDVDFIRSYVPEPETDPALLDEAARLIDSARKPLALVGQGVELGNAQEELKRIDFRLGFDAAFRKHIAALMKTKGVIVTGDLNVAREPIDLRNPDANEGHAGYSAQERESFEKLLSLGLVDTFRHFYPDKTDAYSWWSYRFRAREKNIGWRIDYFLISENMLPFLEDAGIMGDVTGSDHAPIFIDIAK